MSLMIELFKNEFIQITLGATVAIAYAVALNRLFYINRDKRKAEEKRFISALSNGIKKIL